MNTASQGLGNLLVMVILAVAIIAMMKSGSNQKKREAERQAKIAALQKGDRVVISGGIIGTVVGFHDHAVELKLSEGVKMTVLKSGIVGFVPDEQAHKQGGAK